MSYQDKLKPLATSTPSFAAKLKPVSQDNFATTLVKEVARPFARLGVNLLAAGTGIVDPARAKQIDQQGVNIPFLGQTKPVGMSGNFGQDLKDSFGVGIEAASSIAPALKAPALATATVRGAVGAAAKTGLKAGAIGGAQYGVGRELQNPDATVGSVFSEGLKASAFGAAGGGVLGGALATPKALYTRGKAVANRNTPPAIVERRYKELTKLADNNAPVRRVLEKHKSRGFDTSKILAETDLLHGAVDDTGTLRTQNAIAELNDFIRPHEDVISANLEKEGVSLPIRAVRNYLIKAVDDSGLQGAAYTRALKNVEDDLVGYVAKTQSPTIPLSLIHKAKVDKYANINYLNPESKRADKAIAKALKELVEKNTKSVDVKSLNAELSQHFSVLDLLEKLDGRKVQGGKLGKYFAQTIGSIVGSHFGPLGTIIGAEAGGRVQGSVLSSKLRGRTGTGLQRSAAMEAAVQKGKAPPLGLPAPRGGAKVQNNVPIPMGPASSIEPRAQQVNRTVSFPDTKLLRGAGENPIPLQSVSSGNLNQSQSPTNTNTMMNGIAQSLPYSPAVARLLRLETPRNIPSSDKKSAPAKNGAWPTTASNSSKAGNTSTGNAPTGKEGVSAQKADTSAPFEGAKLFEHLSKNDRKLFVATAQDTPTYENFLGHLHEKDTPTNRAIFDAVKKRDINPVLSALAEYNYPLKKDADDLAPKLFKALEADPELASQIAAISRQQLNGVKYLYRYGDTEGSSWATDPERIRGFKFKDTGTTLVQRPLQKIELTPEVLDRVVYADGAEVKMGYPHFANSGETEVILRPSPSIPKELEPLAKEAMKYKTAEEFADALSNANVGELVHDISVSAIRQSDFYKSELAKAQKEIAAGTYKRSSDEPIRLFFDPKRGDFEMVDGYHRLAKALASGKNSIKSSVETVAKKDELTDFHNKVKGNK